MIKHVKISYTKEMFGEEEEFFSGSCDYQTEEELEEFIKEMDNSEEIKMLKFVPGKKIKYYTYEEYVKELEEEVLRDQLDLAKYKLNKNETKKVFSRNKIEPIEGCLSYINGKYYVGLKEVCKEEFEEASDICEKDNHILLLKKCVNRIFCKRIISKIFDLSKLTVADYDSCVDKIAEAKHNDYDQCIGKLKDIYSYALINK